MWVAALSAAAGLASADTAGDESQWRFQLTPYVWAAGMDGRIRPATSLPTVEVDRSFGELLSNSDGAFFLTGSARKDDWVLLGDFTWSSSSQDGQVPVPSVPVPLPASGGTEQVSLTLAGGRTLTGDTNARLDVYAGLRVWSVEGSVSVPALGVDASTRERWADPLIGARFNMAIAERVSFTLQGDLGGAELLGGARSTLQLLAVANWNLGERLYLSAGYRHLSFDYRQDGRVLDIALNGPLLGATWRF